MNSVHFEADKPESALPLDQKDHWIAWLELRD
jgi:hypothetical protein